VINQFFFSELKYTMIERNSNMNALLY